MENHSKNSPICTYLVAFVINAVVLCHPAQAATPTCKPDFKLGKTPISLITGAKPGCVSTKQVAIGKKLLTGMPNTCFVCHSTSAQYPPKQMLINLKSQGYTLKPADISAAFEAHLAEMAGGQITNKDAKAISQYLQSIK